MGRELKNKREHEEADLNRKREFTESQKLKGSALRSSEGSLAASSATPFDAVAVSRLAWHADEAPQRLERQRTAGTPAPLRGGT